MTYQQPTCTQPARMVDGAVIPCGRPASIMIDGNPRCSACAAVLVLLPGVHDQSDMLDGEPRCSEHAAREIFNIPDSSEVIVLDEEDADADS